MFPGVNQGADLNSNGMSPYRLIMMHARLGGCYYLTNGKTFIGAGAAQFHTKHLYRYQKPWRSDPFVVPAVR